MKIIERIVAFSTCAAAMILTLFAAYPATSGKTEAPVAPSEYAAALTLWHVDSFEGGIGSRADFLSSALAEMRDDGIIVLVKTHTKESMNAAILKGELPDLVSFGAGCETAAKFARELSFVSFAGSEKGGKHYAAPWCFGGYYLIAKTDDNRLIEGLNEADEEKTLEKVIVSQGENTLPALALKMAGVTAKSAEYYPPYDAYVRFLGEKNVVLLGTQRDLKRLEKRGVGFSAVPLHGFCDLAQYIAITTKSDEKFSFCVKAVERLLGEEVQKKLGKIGMMRTDGKANENASGSTNDKTNENASGNSGGKANDKTDGNSGGNSNGIAGDDAFFGYDFFRNEFTGSIFLSGEIIRSVQSELKNNESDVKISENVKSGLKRLK